MWTKTADRLPSISDADEFELVLVRDSWGEMLVDWYFVSKDLHYEWARTGGTACN